MADAARQAATGRRPTRFPLYPGPAPGSELWTHAETRYIEERPGFPPVEVLTGVSAPELILHLAPEAETNPLVVICPGGGYRLIAQHHEGAWLAERLVRDGVSAAVLKYRTAPPGPPPPEAAREPSEPTDFARAVAALEAPAALATADGVQALASLGRLGEAVGRRWDAVSLIGFSAGANLVMRLLHDRRAAPAVRAAAVLYGWSGEADAPADAPPLFVASAQDDAVVPPQASLDIFAAWSRARRPAELHVYDDGGHGFGMFARGFAAEAWIDDYLRWLRRHAVAGAG